MNENQKLALGSLYYPYIHIWDLNWLKMNLIIFPYIQRMIPMNFIPDDLYEIREFAEGHKDSPPLLQSADLWSERSLQAQKNLALKLQEDIESEEFILTYGKEAARSMVDNHSYGFQIHAEKLTPELRHALTTGNKLAWKPITPEPYDFDSDYIEVHPRIGEAVMSTLAVACAQASGLDIVGDERSGQLHQCLLEKDLDAVYETWLKSYTQIESPKDATGEELFEFILGIPADLSKLSVEKLRAITNEREPIRELIQTLRIHTSLIPAMDPGKEREDAFKQVANEVMKKWNNDRNNFSKFVREFFSMDAANLTTGFAGKVADKILPNAMTAATVGGASWLGSLMAGGIMGAGGGLIVGLIAHAGKTYYKRRQIEKKSPYRFLTTLEDAGVILQSEAFSQE